MVFFFPVNNDSNNNTYFSFIGLSLFRIIFSVDRCIVVLEKRAIVESLNSRDLNRSVDNSTACSRRAKLLQDESSSYAGR
jgi:hypothetical protein